MAGERSVVPVIVGPTAIGKTAVAMQLALQWPVTVISADSRQIYRRLDIGTAKPTAAERARTPHWGIDVVEPGQRYSAGMYARDAAAWLDAIDPDRQPIVVGGTGFYIRALTEGLFLEPEMDQSARDAFREWAKHRTALAGWARRLDRAFTGGSTQRAARTVEVALLTGRPLSWWHERADQDGAMTPWFVRLTAPRAYLHQRIEARVAEMLAAGWIDEVKGLIDEGIAPDAPGLDGVGYREIIRYLQHDLPFDELHRAITVTTRRYAKRQETWFRHQLGAHPVLTLDATESADTLADRIVTSWREFDR